ncbi:MAG: type II toxin-antitoxin system MqsA family antitoxin [Xanthomonadales bacterium]|nr:type II toxin-antitoxin system MqsA family antitoxin [Xanthomonadales bacterium]
MSLQCDECGIGSLSPAVWEGVFRHGDASIKVTGLECHRCSHCGADPVFTDQIRRNQARIADAKRAHDGLLTGEQVRGVRESLKLSQQLAAQIFGGGANAFSKYERGDVIQSIAMDRLLKVAVRVPGAFEQLCSLAGVPPTIQKPADATYETADGIGVRWEQPLSKATVVSIEDYREQRRA